MKETFYFTHDYNARNDAKIKNLIRKHRLLGYGIYWAIIEDLYQNANALQTDYEGIAFDYHTDVAIVKSIVEDFDLFVFEGNQFGSLSVQRRIDERNQKSQKARDSAHKRWAKNDDKQEDTLKEETIEKCEPNATALPLQSDTNAIKENKVKETKLKESKPKGFVPNLDVLEDWIKRPLLIWLEYKKQKSQKYVEAGWNALVNSIRKNYKSEQELMNAVNWSMSNNWSGLFKNEKDTNSPEPDYKKQTHKF